MASRCLTLLLLIAAAAAQEKAPDAPAPKRESFEVASVKPGDPSDRRMMINIAPGGRFRAVNAPVMLLLRVAYHVRDFQVLGLPEWGKTERFNIEAKSGDRAEEDPMKMSQEQRDAFQKRLQLRLQALLEDRFALKAHRETKEMPVYELVVGKNGPRLPPAAPQTDDKPRGMLRMGRGELSGTAVKMEGLVMALGDITGRTVIDKSGLKGEYDFKLQWTPEPGQMNSMAPPPGAQLPVAEPPDGDASGPSLTTAVQEQLGLKLESTKGPVEVIVIDHVEKPSAN
jgi:uncharacterized protein (TIGR03435 family)